ncbi:glucocorticoid modulatory element-binding protein 1 [Bufo gargarizans]|uniref:glucocorticoid modulatory element-binding protein 1 n=1 Tax=Bufo gargarizans TaxID=30331 RepID=UPI001CF2C2D6|nr:glucocorticoid modulatory element-binding protein 1 [Bufo gargarizans]XP_044142079.1 glucocorticoid modulatory element-binding protein 1 [Bufo gargarizans]
MANAEVTVPMGDVVVIPSDCTEEEDPEDTKTQVILQLQPIPHGMYEEMSDTNAAVVSLETHTLKMGDTLDGGTVELSDDIDIAYPITCGDSKAILLWKKFVCPGINVKCVKFNEQMISPKTFVNLAGKSTLKDWKRAIRLEGVMLRKMMDSGQIDFYQHDKLCTNTCRSTKFDLLISSARAPVPGQSNVVQTPPTGEGSLSSVTVSEETVEDGAIDWGSGLTATVQMSRDDQDRNGEEISEETLLFWKGITDVGLMDEVVSKVQNEIEEILSGVQQRIDQQPFQITDATVLSNIAQTFGLLDVVKKVLDQKRNQTDQSEEQYHYTLADLERQLEEQKKQEGNHSPVLQNVVLMPVNTPKPPKRPRLQRPASAGTLSTQSSQPQYTVLSPLTLAPVGQQFSLGGLRYTTVLGKTGDGDALTVLATEMQDSGSLGGVMSPVELVAMDSELGQDGIGDEGQTIIQIDPAPDPEGGSKVMELGDGKVLGVGHHDGLHNVEIVVLEDE